MESGYETRVRAFFAVKFEAFARITGRESSPLRRVFAHSTPGQREQAVDGTSVIVECVLAIAARRLFDRGDLISAAAILPMRERMSWQVSRLFGAGSTFTVRNRSELGLFGHSERGLGVTHHARACWWVTSERTETYPR